MKKKQIALSLTIIGVILFGFSMGFIYYNDRALSKGEPIEFTANETDVLRGTYYEGSKDAGIILLEGFGSDQITCKSVTSEFVNLGFHVMTFDFSGHGRSLGTLTFDNAQTDRLANQTIAAKELFKTLSGLDYADILLWGHSMGARVALQSQTYDPNPIGGLILFGVQVTLGQNIQSDFFTGVNDSELEWVQSLDSDNPGADILIVTGTLDDILPPSAANALFDKLGGETATYNRELVVLDWLFHNYEVYSPDAIAIAMNWSVEELGLEADPGYRANIALMRKVFWGTSLIGLFLMTICGGIYLGDRSRKDKSQKDTNGAEEGERENDLLDIVRIESMRDFIVEKLKGWLIAIPFIIGIMAGLSIVPGGVPVFNLIYVAFIGGYGILYLIRYKKGKVGGLRGRLDSLIPEEDKTFNKGVFYGLVTAFLLGFFAVLFANSGIYFVFPLNNRLIWLFISAFFTVPGYLIAQLEMKILNGTSESKPKHLLILNLIGLFPFFFYLILFLILRSYSGMLGGVQGVIIMLFVISSGYLVSKISKNLLLTAIFQSILIQMLVLPQGVLFGIF